MKKEKTAVPEVNIGTFGHVDHGKTTLVEALSGKRTDMHSEEKKRGITIRIGYADTTFYKCPKCEKPYCVSPACPKCFSKCDATRTISFVDAPGHETLMATVLSASSIVDGALLLIDAKDGIRDQTREHLMVLDIAQIKKIVVVQNKIDLVSEQEALENYKQIKDLVKGTVAENAPIIPVSAQQKINIDILIEAIENVITTPERDDKKSPRFFVARSFDINKPGTKPSGISGGVLGGSLVQGVLKKGDDIEIKPGIMHENKWKPVHSKIAGIKQGGTDVDECRPGGLIGILTDMDPSLTKSDSLSGNLMGLRGSLPETLFEITIKASIVGKHEIKKEDSIMVTSGVTRTLGNVTASKKGTISMKLRLPVCAEKGERMVLSKQVKGVWHLIGYGELA